MSTQLATILSLLEANMLGLLVQYFGMDGEPEPDPVPEIMTMSAKRARRRARRRRPHRNGAMG
jgi:hypothetical protein